MKISHMLLTGNRAASDQLVRGKYMRERNILHVSVIREVAAITNLELDREHIENEKRMRVLLGK